MNKQSLTVPGPDGSFGSYISKYPPDSGKVPANAFTAGTRNMVSSKSGQMEKRSGQTVWNPTSQLDNSAADQYEAVFASGERLMLVHDGGKLKASSGNNLFTTITSGYSTPSNFEFATYQNRVYFCDGVNTPQVLDIANSYGGVSYSFTLAKTRAAGAQAPVAAPTVVLDTDSTTNQVPAGDHTYKITFVYYNGAEESNGGPASTPVVNDATHTSNDLSAIPVGGYGVSARNIYRDNNDDNWLLLDTILDNTTTTYTDILAIGGTPTPIPQGHELPPSYKYIALYLDRLFVIETNGKVIAWSNAGEPDVFNPVNTINGPQDDVMSAIYVFNGIPWVFGQHTTGVILGNTDGTFYYSPISTTVGCVDNRSIQTRSLVSVPMMLWLSSVPNKGIYGTNGSTVQYLSDFIEDLTFELVQIAFLGNSQIQASQSDFEGGTSSPGIDLSTNPGVIQTINPTKQYSHAADWATGVLSNLAAVGDTLVVPTDFEPTLAGGTLGGSAEIVSTNVTLPAASVFTGESNSDTGSSFHIGADCSSQTAAQGLAQAFIPAATGTLTSIIWQWISGGISTTINAYIYTDSAGAPGTLVAGPVSYTYGGGAVTHTFAFSAALTGGTKYWAVLDSNDGGSFISDVRLGTAGLPSDPSQALLTRGFSSPCSGHGSWGSNAGKYARIIYAFTQTPVSDSGTWQSAVHDTGSTTLTFSGATVTVSGTWPANTTGTLKVQGSANGTTGWTTTDTLTTPNGVSSITGGSYRYWRILDTISTTDNTSVPLISAPILAFDTAGTWTSPAILNTTDITTLDSLAASVTVPSGTSYTATIATSTDNITYSSFTAIGSAIPHKWSKIKLTLHAKADDTATPVLISATLDWSIVATFISSAIDSGVAPPDGWGLFLYSQLGTSGTITSYFRSATSSGGLPAAMFSSVTEGGYPTSTPLEFAQYKFLLGASANNIPEIDDVTVQWFIGLGPSVRCASLFFNKSYYLSVATAGNTKNNLVIEYDYQGNWRLHDGWNWNTMVTYFNQPYAADSANENVYSLFNSDTDAGTSIAMDIRTKCFNYGDDLHLKSIRSLKVTGVNTGTLLHAYYSIDRGATWIEMLNSSGSTGYQTSGGGDQFVEYFIPDYSGAYQTGARNLVFRITSADAFPCQILQLVPTVYGRKGKAIREAMA